MKRGKRPTRRERILLKNNKLDPAEWLIYKNTLTGLHLVHRQNGQTRIIPNGGERL